MRGLGGVYKRGPVYWIRYHHRGREFRESARSTDRGDAVRLLKARLSDVSYGRPNPADEESVTFDQLVATSYRLGDVSRASTRRRPA